MKRYKLTLLKDLPDTKAGTSVSVSKKEFEGVKSYDHKKHDESNFDWRIYQLRNDPEWVKVEADDRCLCQVEPYKRIQYRVIGYGRSFTVSLDFKKKKIYTWYDHACDQGTEKSLHIRYCPLCGRKL